MKHHIMWDIETFGIERNAVIWEIGAVKFTRNGIVDKFQVGIDPGDFQKRGGVIDASTVEYWMQDKMQSARERFNNLAKVVTMSALCGLAEWCTAPMDGTGQLVDDYEVGSAFGKGSTFDNVLLRDAYAMIGEQYPFHFRSDECYRTIVNRFPGVPYTQFGVAHSGVDDAVSQAEHLIAINNAHGLNL